MHRADGNEVHALFLHEVVEVGLVLEVIGVQLLAVQSHVGLDIIGVFHDLDFVALGLEHLIGHFQKFSMGRGGRAHLDFDGFGSGQGRKSQSGAQQGGGKFFHRRNPLFRLPVNGAPHKRGKEEDTQGMPFSGEKEKSFFYPFRARCSAFLQFPSKISPFAYGIEDIADVAAISDPAVRDALCFQNGNQISGRAHTDGQNYRIGGQFHKGIAEGYGGPPARDFQQRGTGIHLYPGFREHADVFSSKAGICAVGDILHVYDGNVAAFSRKNKSRFHADITSADDNHAAAAVTRAAHDDLIALDYPWPPFSGRRTGGRP